MKKCASVLILLIFGIVSASTVTVYENGKLQTPNPSHITREEIELHLSAEAKRLLQEFEEWGVPRDVAISYLPSGGVIDRTKSHLPKEVPRKRGEVLDSNSLNIDDTSANFDPWSIVWYIGSFGGLIAFFLVVSCSEWCCGRNRNSSTDRASQSTTSGNPARHRLASQRDVAPTPPPAYHLFAPPEYDSVEYEEKTDRYEVYVVPVHAMSVDFVERHQESTNVPPTTELPPPPPYTAVSMPPT